MAIDVVESPKKPENPRVIKVWKKFNEWKFLRFIQNVRMSAIYNWKFLAFILIGVLMAYMFGYKIDTSSSEVNEFISQAKMKALLEVEQKLVKAMSSYADELQHKVDVIRSGLAQMRKPTEIDNINAEEFLKNPLNSFPMLRRLKTEWKAWQIYLNKFIGRDHICLIHNLLDDIPNFDLLETLNGFESLREIYDIQPANWIEGKLQNKTYDKKFSSLDAYSMAFLLNKRMNYTEANDWFLIALEAYEDCEMYSFMNFNRSFIYRSYADNLLKQNLTEQSHMAAINTTLETESDKTNSSSKSLSFEEKEKLDLAMKRCCRGENVVENSSQLHCYYNSSTNDFVRLAPFKVEELHLDPIVLLYHDIISDDEISELKVLSKDDMKQSETGINKISKYRTSENAWIDFDRSHGVSVIIQRIEDMTGLLAKDEKLLVGNYSPGGLYKMHLDCISLDDRRIMTVLLYLSDVDSGGATVFPKLQLSVFPQKGKAIIWYNLHNDMQQCDNRTMHMGCPVIVGSKWFAVKWIRFFNQAFRKPCFKNTTNDKYEVQHNP